MPVDTGNLGDTCLALPKLNLQFLTLADYLLRNFQARPPPSSPLHPPSPRTPHRPAACTHPPPRRSRHPFLAQLFRLEATREIKQDTEDVVTRLQPRRQRASGGTSFKGWARMALPISEFRLFKVGKPFLV